MGMTPSGGRIRRKMTRTSPLEDAFGRSPINFNAAPMAIAARPFGKTGVDVRSFHWAAS